MGKKKSGSNGAGAGAGAEKQQQKQKPAVAFVLRVPTHCRCDGCDDKVRAGVRDLARRCGDAGIVSLDQSALATKGELAVVATADPEKLRRRLSKRTGKTVDLVFPKPPADAGGKDAANVQALLAALMQQQQQQQQAAQARYYGLPMHGGGYGLPAAAYPWVLQQQAAPPPPPEPYFAPYPAASWGAAYPHAGDPHTGIGGGGWFGY